MDLEVLLRGKGNYCFNEENFKNGYGLYCLWRNRWGFRPRVPPLDPPLVTEVANVDSTNTDADSLISLEINVSFTIFHHIKENKI